MSREEANAIYPIYNQIIRTLVGMINHPETWIISDKMIHEETESYGDPF
jgi:hypothetical protein